MTVETHHTIKARTGEKNEIVWTMLCIESVTYFAEMCIAVFISSGE